jgi:hypothetical protein
MIAATGIDQQNTNVRILRQTQREQATSGTGTDNNVIKTVTIQFLD